MGIKKLSQDSKVMSSYLQQFQHGDQRALNFVYRNSFQSLQYVGKTLINDQFLISCILHDCYLKAWTNRARMESLPHIYRFIRMNMRWQILRHIEKSSHTIYGQTLHLDHVEQRIDNYFEDSFDDKETCESESHKLKMASESIKYLSDESQQVVALYFYKGLTHKQIADRLGKSTSQISDQLYKSINQLKSMLQIPKKEIKKNLLRDDKFQTGILDAQQSQIYDLRKNQKLSFNAIALKLGLSQNQTQQQYIKVHQLLQNQSRPKAPSRF